MALYTSTIAEISIHTEPDSPIFGESVIKVRLNDHAAGIFIELSSNNPDDSTPSTVTLDIAQFYEVAKAVDTLTKQPGLNHDNNCHNYLLGILADHRR